MILQLVSPQIPFTGKKFTIKLARPSLLIDFPQQKTALFSLKVSEKRSGF